MFNDKLKKKLNTNTKISNQNFTKAIAAKKWLVVVFVFLKVSGFGQDTVYLLGYNKIYYFDVNTCTAFDSVVVNSTNFSSIGLNIDGNIYGCSTNYSTGKFDSVYVLNPIAKAISVKCINLNFGSMAGTGSCFDDQGNLIFLEYNNSTNSTHVLKYNINSCSLSADYDLRNIIGIDGDLEFINGNLFVTYKCKIWQVDLSGNTLPTLVFNSTYPCNPDIYDGYYGFSYTCYQNLPSFIVSNYDNGNNKLYRYNPITEEREVICNLNFVVYDAANKSPDVNFFFLGKDTTLCSFNNFKLITNIASTKWSTGQVGSTISITQPGKYWATVINSCGTYTDTINIYQTLIAKRDTAFSICQNDTLLYNHKKYFTQGIFYDTIKAITNCDSVQKVRIAINNSNTTIINQSVCQGTLLFGSIMSKDTVISKVFSMQNSCDSIVNYQITVNKITSSSQNIQTCRYSVFQGVVINNDTIIYKTYYNIFNCDSLVTYHIQVTDSIVRNIDTAVCSGTLFANKILDKDTVLQLRENSSANCDSIINYNIKVHPLPIVFIEDTIVSDDSILLKVSGAEIYHWSNGTTANTMYVDAYRTTTYFVVGTDSNTCKAKDTITVIGKNADIFISTAFSPNHDGVNDELTVFVTKLISYHLEIYNRWNQLLFVSDTLQNKWNGTYKGEEVPVDSYLYILKVTTANGKQIQKQGVITLLR